MDDELRLRAGAARADLQRGRLRGRALRDLVHGIPTSDRDVWVDEVLALPHAPPDVPDLPRGAVPCLSAGVDEILAMIEEVPVTAEDVVVDLGSGLGRVAILAHLLTGARTHGIEIQAHLVELARTCCVDLSLAAVTFAHANAEDVELDGSIFFLYAPFNGEMLRRVLGRLEAVARRRAITVCAVDFELHDLPWLTPRPTAHRALALYASSAHSDFAR